MPPSGPPLGSAGPRPYEFRSQGGIIGPGPADSCEQRKQVRTRDIVTGHDQSDDGLAHNPAPVLVPAIHVQKLPSRR